MKLTPNDLQHMTSVLSTLTMLSQKTWDREAVLRVSNRPDLADIFVRLARSIDADRLWFASFTEAICNDAEKVSPEAN